VKTTFDILNIHHWLLQSRNPKSQGFCQCQILGLAASQQGISGLQKKYQNSNLFEC